MTGGEVDRGIVRYTLSELPVVTQLRQDPKFVFAISVCHIHLIYVGPNGGRAEASLLMRSYADRA